MVNIDEKFSLFFFPKERIMLVGGDYKMMDFSSVQTNL